MLDPSQRRMLADMLKPPEGFEMDEAVCCTYSLDLLALAGVPLACMNLEPTLVEQAEEGAALAALECVRRQVGRFTVFCQAGALHVPREFRDVFLWLEQCVVEVMPGRAGIPGVFHPKLWLVCFKAEDGRAHYRVVVLSRNLTYDRCWDIVTALEGPLIDRQRAIGANQPLVDFVLALGSEIPSVRPLAAAHADRVARFAHALGRVRFDPPEDATAWCFWPIGIRGHTYRVKDLFTGKRSPFRDLTKNARLPGRELLCVTPFVSVKLIQALSDSPLATRLVSREVALDEMGDALPVDWQDAADCRLHAFLDLAIPESALSGLHAKLWIGDDGRQAHAWVGSANGTDAAFERNVEFLLQLSGPKSVFGIAGLTGKPGAEEGKCFADFLAPYVANPTLDETAESTRQRERALGYLLFDIAAGSSLTASVVEDEGRYRLALAVATPIPGHVALTSRPVTLTHEAAALARDAAVGGFCYGELELHQLTEFWCVELRDQELAVSGVTRVPPVGMPEMGQREPAALARHLRDLNSLSLYLEFLLAGSSKELQRQLRERRRRHEGAGAGTQAGKPLFELMLQALASRHHALADVEALLAIAGTGSALTANTEFRELWHTVCAARDRVEGKA